MPNSESFTVLYICPFLFISSYLLRASSASAFVGPSLRLLIGGYIVVSVHISSISAAGHPQYHPHNLTSIRPKKKYLDSKRKGYFSATRPAVPIDVRGGNLLSPSSSSLSEYLLILSAISYSRNMDAAVLFFYRTHRNPSAAARNSGPTSNATPPSAGALCPSNR